MNLIFRFVFMFCDYIKVGHYRICISDIKTEVKVYEEPCQTSMMELFQKLTTLTLFIKLVSTLKIHLLLRREANFSLVNYLSFLNLRFMII